ncbi:MAG: DUF1624 domain-containing protein [Microbacteriaceae bacterium]|nr:DUF1624 domain-containing protein [Microbacteriaceae bacterium]
MHPAPAERRGATARVDGIDLARFVALAGMMLTHTWIFTPDYLEPAPSAAISGKAAALFAVLAGVGIAFTSRRALARGDRRTAAGNLLGRGLALVLIGLTLGLVSPIILVILVYYGVMFWLVIPLLRLGPRALLAGAVLWMLAWPFAAFALGEALGAPPPVSSPTWFSLADPAALVRNVLLDGAYPALTWLAYPVVGLALGRWLLRARDEGPDAVRRLGALALVGGGLVALVAWGGAALAARAGGAARLGAELGLTREEALALLHDGPGSNPFEHVLQLLTTAGHTGAPPDLLITAGLATAVIGAGLLAGLELGPRMRALLGPVLGAGGAPLTVYSAHVLAFAPGALLAFGPAMATGEPLPWWLSSPWLWLVHVAGALVLGALLRWSGQRGPLEQLVTASGRLAAPPRA